MLGHEKLVGNFGEYSINTSKNKFYFQNKTK